MLDYVEGMLAELPVDMAGESATPAADHLFQVNTDDPIKLDEENRSFSTSMWQNHYFCGREEGQTYRPPWLSYALG